VLYIFLCATCLCISTQGLAFRVVLNAFQAPADQSMRGPDDLLSFEGKIWVVFLLRSVLSNLFRMQTIDSVTQNVQIWK